MLTQTLAFISLSNWKKKKKKKHNPLLIESEFSTQSIWIFDAFYSFYRHKQNVQPSSLIFSDTGSSGSAVTGFHIHSWQILSLNGYNWKQFPSTASPVSQQAPLRHWFSRAYHSYIMTQIQSIRKVQELLDSFQPWAFGGLAVGNKLKWPQRFLHFTLPQSHLTSP